MTDSQLIFLAFGSIFGFFLMSLGIGYFVAWLQYKHEIEEQKAPLEPYKKL